jgi:hypothetical protein
MQSRLGSLVEAFLNVAIGFWVALLTQIVVFPLYGMNVDLGQNLEIGAIFTVIAIIRSYVVRRVFNRFRPRPKK